MNVFKLLVLLSLSYLSSSNAKLKINNATTPMDGLCSLSSYLSQGTCKFSNEGLICRRGFTKEWVMRVRYDVIHLEVLEWPGDCINIDRLQKYFPELQTLDIINSTVLKYFKGHFDSTSKIRKIEIHGMTSLWEVPSEMVKRMGALKLLDLRNNVLRHMKADLLRGPPQLEVVLLSDRFMKLTKSY